MIPRNKILHLVMGVLAILCALLALAVYERFGLGPTLAYTTTAVGVFYEVQQWWRRERSTSSRWPLTPPTSRPLRARW